MDPTLGTSTPPGVLDKETCFPLIYFNVKVLSCMLSSGPRKWDLSKGVRIARGAPSILHLLFTDDSFIFCKVNLKKPG